MRSDLPQEARALKATDSARSASNHGDRTLALHEGEDADDYPREYADVEYNVAYEGIPPCVVVEQHVWFLWMERHRPLDSRLPR
jgi:hypothetical protein